MKRNPGALAKGIYHCNLLSVIYNVNISIQLVTYVVHASVH